MLQHLMNMVIFAMFFLWFPLGITIINFLRKYDERTRQQSSKEKHG